MKSDFQTRDDIELLVTTFYEKARRDPLIGPIFNSVVKINWKKHLQLVADFWENTLFFTGAYTGNPIATHRRLNKIFPLQDEHFNQWVALFIATVNELFEGEKALLAKRRAFSIATVMKIKVLQLHPAHGSSLSEPEL